MTTPDNPAYREPHGWTHPICADCWDHREPDRDPVRLTDPEEERCCVCGERTWSGIYIRAAALTLQYCSDHASS